MFYPTPRLRLFYGGDITRQELAMTDSLPHSYPCPSGQYRSSR